MIKNGVTDFFFVDKNRATLAIEGEDKIDFLQALTTNNIEKVSKEGIIYTAILSPQGKYLYDFFVFSLGRSLSKRIIIAMQKFNNFFTSPYKIKNFWLPW